MQPLIARCECGKVEVEATGLPIASAICYCTDCQAAARQIEALPNARRVREPDGGVGYLPYRKDRVRIARGTELLRPYKLREKSPTNRMVASCCNAAVILTFNDSRHWVNVFRTSVTGDVPPVQLRICTRSRQGGDPDTSVPAFSGYPLRFIVKLVAARLAMTMGR